jgi:hypothetical protein
MQAGDVLKIHCCKNGGRFFAVGKYLTRMELFSNIPSVRGKMESERARYFRTELQKAREDALKDAEAFDGIIHVIEKLGQFLCKPDEPKVGLFQYQKDIEEVAKESALAAEVPSRFRNIHIGHLWSRGVTSLARWH